MAWDIFVPARMPFCSSVRTCVSIDPLLVFKMSDLDAAHGLAIAAIVHDLIKLTDRLTTMNSEHAKDKLAMVRVVETQRNAHVELSRQVGEMSTAVVTLQSTVAAQEMDIAALKLERVQSEVDAIKADTEHIKANQS
jgi:hypothetical protein